MRAVAAILSVLLVALLYLEYRPTHTPTVEEATGAGEARESAPRPALKYEEEIRGAVRKHWPVEWWEYEGYWRAQLIAESSMDEETCKRANHKGAKCLAQITPITAEELERIGFVGDSRADAVASIYGGALYMAHLDRMNARLLPERDRDQPCRLVNSQVAYITGPANLKKAVVQAAIPHKDHPHGGVCWRGDIEHHLPRVIAKENARDVRNYLAKIAELGAAYLTGGVVRVNINF